MDEPTPEDIAGLARLRRHLREGGSARLPEAAAACGLRISALARWLSDGRLRRVAPAAATTRVACVVCTNAAPHDLCDGCRRRLVAAGDGGLGAPRRPASPAPVPGAGATARRHSRRRT